MVGADLGDDARGRAVPECAPGHVVGAERATRRAAAAGQDAARDDLALFAGPGRVPAGVVQVLGEDRQRQRVEVGDREGGRAGADVAVGVAVADAGNRRERPLLLDDVDQRDDRLLGLADDGDVEPALQRLVRANRRVRAAGDE